MECRPLTKDERHFKSQIEIVKQFLDLIDEVEESPMSLNRYIKELKQRIIGEKHFFVEDDIIANSPQKVSKPAVLVSEDTNSTESVAEKLKEKLWEHPSTFEGIKCKTCLPLDYVDRIIDEMFSIQNKQTPIDIILKEIEDYFLTTVKGEFGEGWNKALMLIKERCLAQNKCAGETK